MLPQQARFCLPLEAGSSLGCLVYPALADHESFTIRRHDGGTLRFSFFGGDPERPSHQFTLQYSMPAGGVGIYSEDVSYRASGGMSDAEIACARDALLRLSSLWVPAGAVALRGAYDFRTPPGWDTVYTGVLNQASPPNLFCFTSRVETDWYAMETEFRYVLQPGDVLSGSAKVPVGQVFAVPRVPVVVECADEEAALAFHTTQDEVLAAKMADRSSTAMGLEYDTYYRQRSRIAAVGDRERRSPPL